MTEKAEPPTREVSFLLLMMILVILVLSVGALYYAVTLVINTNEIGTDAMFFVLIGFVGLSSAAYMLLQTKRKPLQAALEMPRVITTILCQKCGFKNVRDFQRGDYVFKETDSCPKCNEKMMIASIYREVKEKEK